MSDSSLKAIRDELQAINDDAYGGAHPFVRYYRSRVRVVLAIVEALIDDPPPCPGFPNCRHNEWATPDDPHGVFGAPGMMGG